MGEKRALLQGEKGPDADQRERHGEILERDSGLHLQGSDKVEVVSAKSMAENG